MSSNETTIWTVEVDDRSRRELRSLDRPIQTRLLGFLRSRVATGESPRRLGHPLTGRRLGLWRYRVGPNRLICRIVDRDSVVLVLRIRHRSEAYRG